MVKTESAGHYAVPRGQTTGAAMQALPVYIFHFQNR